MRLLSKERCIQTGPLCAQGRVGRHRPRICAFAAVAAALFICGRAAVAAPATDRFEAANRLYEQGRFKEAAAAYQELLNSGFTSPAVYFNLGNAFFKSGQLGAAIAAHREAQRLAPRDPDIEANLRFIREQVQGPRLTPNLIQRWLGRLTLNEWTLLCVAAFWICLLSLAALQLRPARKTLLRGIALAAGAATMVLGACLAGAWSSVARPVAIANANDIAVRNGPIEESPSTYTVHDGAELRVLDQKDGWLLVDAGLRPGWLKREDVILWPSGRQPDGTRASD
ncbi:MAG TPA: tetratricopeptide repeat protein [Verrucomicrobia bacterium]|nr:tetratricopeptide repeat protein [Verrucomicrobiota bacterium]HOB32531.1 tetratricopeptide repeat protein [Verrucomicrobiota bacterium]HOP97781.1 tetratricopeptide repeat protein [Verrucomicrobiota bacterium]HPU55269.1 tetratricopeptide repeat protein [Verrucomicrobiota bacterium]